MAKIISTICFLVLFIPAVCFANCPLQVSHLSDGATLIESNYSKFKIEKDWIKQLYPSPTDDDPWVYSAIGQGSSHIRGIFKNADDTEKTFSEFYAVRKGGETYWYLIVQDRLGWVVAGSARGEFSCKYVSDPTTLIEAVNARFQSVGTSQTELRIDHPSRLYTRLGLN